MYFLKIIFKKNYFLIKYKYCSVSAVIMYCAQNMSQNENRRNGAVTK